MKLLVKLFSTFFLFLKFSSAAKQNLENVLSPLAPSLQLESCDIVLVGLTHSEIQFFADNLPRSISVLSDSNKSRESNSNCQALVQKFDCLTELIIINKQIKEVKIVYIIFSSHNIQNLNEIVMHVYKPTVIFSHWPNGQTQIILACPNSPKLKYINLWKPGNGFTSNTTRIGHQTLCPSELENQHVKTVITARQPYVVSSKNNGWTGADPSILAIVAEKMHFTYTMNYERTWGARNRSTGKWNAMIGKVMNGEAVLGIGLTSMQSDRHQVVDYSTYTYQNSIHIVSRKPKPRISYVNFIRPFDYAIWSALLISLVLATLTLVLVTKLRMGKKEEKEETDIGKIVLACYRSQLQACLKFKSTRHSVWILFGFYFVHVFFINSSYLCNFRVYVMQTEYEPPIDSDYDLYKYHRNVLLLAGSIIPALFEQSPIAIQREIFKNSDKKSSYYEYEKGEMPRRCEELMIDTGVASIANKLSGICSFGVSESRFGYVPFRMSKQPIFAPYCGVIMAKKSPWRNEIDTIVLGLLQGGIIDRLLYKFVPGKYLREEKDDTSPRPFGTKHVLGSLLILSGGLTLGMVAFFVESVWKTRKGLRRK